MYFSLFDYSSLLDVLQLVLVQVLRLFDVFKIDVLPIVWCTSACFTYFGLFDVLMLVLIDVLPIVWCTSACLITQAYWMYFSMFWLKYFDCLMYFSLFYVLQLVLCTSACFTYFSLFYVLQLTKNFAELRWSKNWYNWYCNTDPSRRVLPPTKQRFIAHCTLQTICLLVRNHHRLRTEFYWKLKRSYSESETRFSQSNYNAQLVGRTGVESGSFNKTDRKTGPGLHGFRFLLISHNLYILHRR